ncbi:ABC transporter ATP-binding protein [Thermodesulfobacteriota bacterium]
MSYIKADNLVKEYGRNESTFIAVKGMSFEIEQGEFVAVMGESGSGKSTLLSIMGALNTPTGGIYEVDDIDVYSLGQDQRAEFRREFLGFIFQSFYLIPYLTVLENIMFPLATLKMKGSEKRDMAEYALEQVGLNGKEDRLPGEISGGEQERVAIARAVVNEPTILLADEPTGNLDTRNSRVIMDLFQTMNRNGITIVMVTHSRECALNARRILRVSDGLLMDEDRFIRKVGSSADDREWSEAKVTVA